MPKDHTSRTMRLHLEGLSCASCVARAEKALAGVKGVESARVNLADQTADVQFGARHQGARYDRRIGTGGVSSAAEKYTLSVEGMTCAACTGGWSGFCARNPVFFRPAQTFLHGARRWFSGRQHQRRVIGGSRQPCGLCQHAADL